MTISHDHSMPLRPAVFMDRDGTVNVEVHYLSEPDQVQLLPTVAETILQLNSSNTPVVVVTNQAGIARGFFPESQLELVHNRLHELLIEHRAKVDGVYYCPHHPSEGIGEYRIECECRKPKPGMLKQAAADLWIDLTRSLMIGDRESDLAAGANAGCVTALVKTGYGLETSTSIDLKQVNGIGVFESVREAVLAWTKLRLSTVETYE